MSYPPVPPSEPTRPMPAPPGPGWSPPTPPAGSPWPQSLQQPGWPQPASPQSAPPPPKKSNTGLIIGIIVGAVLVCGGLATAGFILAGRVANTISDGGQPGVQTYELGQAATVGPDGVQWRVTVSRAEWFDEPCTLLGVLLSERAVVLDVTIEVVAGQIGLISPADFEFYTDDGALNVVGVNASGCVQTPLELAADVPAGRTLDGQIDFDVPSGGDVRYVVPTVDGSTAAWRIRT